MFLPNNEHTFHVKIQCSKTGEWFEGDFTTKCILTNEERIDVACRVDRYNRGSATLAPQYMLLNQTIAELEVRICRTKEGKLRAPTWWTESDGGRLLYDTEVVYCVFKNMMDGEKAWGEKLKKKSQADTKLAEDKPRRVETPPPSEVPSES